MKIPLSFYLVAAAAGMLACSDEGGTDRENVGGSTQQVAQAGSSGSGGASGAAGSGQGTSGAGGGSTGGPRMGEAFVITAGDATDNGVTGLVVDSAGTTGIDGIAQVIKSPMGTTVTSTIKDGALCMEGTTVVVPNMDYTNYWGAEIDLDLKLVDSNGNGSNTPATVADAGADAGGDAGSSGPPPARTPIGWNASTANVVGFSFKLTGQVPVAFRFKGLPYGADPAATTYCYQVAATDGTTVNINFSQITFECWNPNGAAVLSMPYPPDNPDGKLLRTISWQVPADINIPFPFNFCVSEIKPILGN
jgi:hypothetical protein